MRSRRGNTPNVFGGARRLKLLGRPRGPRTSVTVSNIRLAIFRLILQPVDDEQIRGAAEQLPKVSEG
jgi:hypothetical protein